MKEIDITPTNPESDQPSDQPARDLRIAVIGKSELARVTYASFLAARGVEVSLMDADQLEEPDLWPDLTFICDRLPVKRNGVQDESGLVKTCQQLLSSCATGICIRATMSIETTGKLIMALTKPAFDAKVVYFPETEDVEDTYGMATSSVQIIGGTEDAVKPLMNIISQTSTLSLRNVVSGTVFDAVYTQFGVQGIRTVKQKFFEQFNAAVLDLQNSNPILVRRMIESSGVLQETRSLTSTDMLTSDTVTRQDEDIRMFISGTDTMPILDSLIKSAE